MADSKPTTTASHYAHMSAADVLQALCPMGDAAAGVTVDQDWDAGSTRIEFSDGSGLVVSGPVVEVDGD